MTEDLDVLLARYAGPGSTGERERALLDRLPEAKREIVVKRLGALDAFIAEQAAGSARPTETAGTLGITVRSLYRLVARLKELGAIAALAPQQGAGRKRRSDADATLPKEVVDLIFQEVLRHPHQPMGVLISKAKELDPGVSPTTVRRRAMMYRKNLDPMADAEFGRAWVLDQAALRIPVLDDGGASWLVCSFLVDVDTGIVCGRAPVEGPNDPGFEALLHGLERIKALTHTKLRFASRVAEVSWTVPDGWLGKGQEVSDRALGLRPPVVAAVSMSGKFRRGSKLSTVTGGSIGMNDILIRATADPRARLESDDPPPMDRAAALDRLDDDMRLVDQRTARWVKPSQGVKPPSRTRMATLTRLAGRLVDVFEPALSEAQLSEARRLVAAIGRETDPRRE